ncbi:MAG: outer membrane lipoprotein chaperone LolA [Sodalis sp. (in: enterobacteria)]
MKKWFITTYLFCAILAFPAFANDTSVLQKRLNQVKNFHANFTQQVTRAEGDIVQEGMGELWIKRPNLFNWHMITPDESILVSDGETLWFYNPFLEQVTANWLINETSNMPFMLITRNNVADWVQYAVKKQGDSFSLVPKSDNSNLKQFIINITDNGTIIGFTTVEQDGQRNAYQLKNQQNGPVDAAKFHFTLPKGVTLDDQRQ